MLALPPGVNECRWASCSVYDNLAELDNLMKLPKNRDQYKFATELTLHANTGVVKPGRKGHYDWWIKSGFTPEQHSKIAKAY